MILGCSGFTWISGGRHYLGRTVDRAGAFSEHSIIGMGRGVFCANTLDGDAGERGKLAYVGLTIDVPQCIGRKTHPIWIDGVNECGLMIALLNFPGESAWEDSTRKTKVHPGRLVPYLLSRCRAVDEAADAIENIALTDEGLPMRVHYLIGDRSGRCMTAEPDERGLKVRENPIGVLTNAPELERHIANLRAFSGESADLPGDFSSESRFVRLAHIKKHAVTAENESESISKVINILAAVSVPDGLDEREGYRTMFTTAMSAEEGEYCVLSSRNHRLSRIRVSDLRVSETKIYEIE